MRRRFRPWLCTIPVLLLTTGCVARTAPPQPLSASTFSELAVPLNLLEFNVVGAGAERGLFLKLTRLPDSLTHRAESNPARIVLDIAGPTGEESPEEAFTGGDALVTRLIVSRTFGWLRIAIDLQSEDVPEYSVHQMADYIMVRFAPPS